jgi:hypothetical protein
MNMGNIKKCFCLLVFIDNRYLKTQTEFAV